MTLQSVTHHALQRSLEVVDDVRAPAHAALGLHHQVIRAVRVVRGRVRVVRDVFDDNLLCGPAPTDGQHKYQITAYHQEHPASCY